MVDRGYEGWCRLVLNDVDGAVRCGIVRAAATTVLRQASGGDGYSRRAVGGGTRQDGNQNTFPG